MDLVTISIEIYSQPNLSSTDEALNLSFLAKVPNEISKLWMEFGAQDCYRQGPVQQGEDGIVIYPGTFTAYIISYFEASRILYEVVMERQACTVNPIRTQTILGASSSILSCAQYLEDQNMGCAFILIVLPLLLVARHGSSVEHLEGALGFFDRWQANQVFRGYLVEKADMESRKYCLKLCFENHTT
jgi:hypothetical protein